MLTKLDNWCLIQMERFIYWLDDSAHVNQELFEYVLLGIAIIVDITSSFITRSWVCVLLIGFGGFLYSTQNRSFAIRLSMRHTSKIIRLLLMSIIPVTIMKGCIQHWTIDWKLNLVSDVCWVVLIYAYCVTKLPSGKRFKADNREAA